MKPKSASRGNRYLLGLGTGYGYNIFSILIGFWLTPFILSIISREEMGVVTLASSLIAWGTIVYIGAPAALNLQLSRHGDKPDIAQISRLLSTGLVTQITLSLLVLIVGLLASPLFVVFFEISPQFVDAAILTVAITVTHFSFNQVKNVFGVTLFAFQQIHIDNLLMMLHLLLSTVFTVVGLLSGIGMIALPLGHLVAGWITGTINIVRVYRLLPGLQLRLRLFAWRELFGIWNIGMWASLGSVAGLLVRGTDQIVVGRLISVEMITVFVLTASLFSRSDQFLRRMFQNVRPILSARLAEGDTKNAYHIFQRVFQVSTGTALVVVCAIWAGNQAFVTWWVGAENFGGNWLSLAFALNLLANLWTYGYRMVLMADLKMPAANLTYLLEAILNLVLSIIMTLAFGLFGTAFSTFLAHVLSTATILPTRVARTLNREPRQFLSDTYLPIARALLPLIPTVLVMKILSDNISGLLGAAVGGGGVFVIGITILWFFTFDASVKSYLSELIAKASGRVLKRRIVLYVPK